MWFQDTTRLPMTVENWGRFIVKINECFSSIVFPVRQCRLVKWFNTKTWHVWMSLCCGVDLWRICEVSWALVKCFKRLITVTEGEIWICRTRDGVTWVKWKSYKWGPGGCQKVGWFNPGLVKTFMDVFRHLELWYKYCFRNTFRRVMTVF